MDAKQISELMAKKAEEIARYLLPGGKVVGGEYCTASIRGGKGDSLKVNLRSKAGIWCDFAENEMKGDLIDLWMKVRNINLPEALKEIKNYLQIFVPIIKSPVNFNSKKKFIIPTVSNNEIKNESPVFKYLIEERKINIDILRKYKIGENEREIVFNFLRDGETLLIKYCSLDRDIKGKKKIRSEPDGEPCLFGWDVIPKNSRGIILCEGEIDCMSFCQYGYTALSVPFGATNHQWIENEIDRLSQFEEIYICFDNDDAGKKGSLEVASRLGIHRCVIVTLPKNDVNECLTSGISKDEIKYCLSHAKSLDPIELKRGNSILDELINEFYPDKNQFMGYLAPWKKTHNFVKFRNKEVSLWTGYNFHGKSQFLSEILLSFMKQGAKVCIASLELKPRKLLKRFVKLAANAELPTQDYIYTINNWFCDKLWYFDLVGSTKYERLLEVFKYAHQRYGIDVFVIDSYMKLDFADDDYTAQSKFMGKLFDFVNLFNCQIHLVAHPKKPSFDDESKKPNRFSISGAGNVSNQADNCFCIWRNKKKEILKEKISNYIPTDLKSEDEEKILSQSDVEWIVDKMREDGFSGTFGFDYRKESGRYHPRDKSLLEPYVEYSKIEKSIVPFDDKNLF